MWLSQYIDVDSFIDYFILVELSKNTDGYRLSISAQGSRRQDPLIHMDQLDYDLAFAMRIIWKHMITWLEYPCSRWMGTPFWWSKLVSDPYLPIA